MPARRPRTPGVGTTRPHRVPPRRRELRPHRRGRLREGPPPRTSPPSMRSLLGRAAAGSGHRGSSFCGAWQPQAAPGTTYHRQRAGAALQGASERATTHPRSLPLSLFLVRRRPPQADGWQPQVPVRAAPKAQGRGKRLFLPSWEAACALPPPQPLPEAPSEVRMAGRTRRPRAPSPPARGGAAAGHPPGPPPLPARGPSAGRCRAGRCRASRQRPLRGRAGRARESRRCRGGRGSGGAGGGSSREQSGGGAATR